MSNPATCPECGAPLPADAPAGVCPKCLLEAGLPDAGGFPALHVRCPHCHNPVEIVDDQPLKEITCPSCDSRFSLIDDQTVDYRTDAPKTIGRFELVSKLGTGAFGTV